MSDAAGQGVGYGELRRIEGFEGVVGRVWEELKDGGEGVEVKREKAAEVEGGVDGGNSGGLGLGLGARMRGMKLDEGQSLLVASETVGLAARGIVREVEGILGGVGGEK